MGYCIVYVRIYKAEYKQYNFIKYVTVLYCNRYINKLIKKNLGHRNLSNILGCTENEKKLLNVSQIEKYYYYLTRSCTFKILNLHYGKSFQEHSAKQRKVEIQTLFSK